MSRRARSTNLILCAIFFVSGASALIFETIWFQLAGITFGNSVWAGSIVLTSFMGGLALGNALAARYGQRIARPLVIYARIEVLIAVTGVLLILALPRLSAWLVPLFRPLIDSPWLINPLRLLFGFLLMLVPTTAMGMTLPLLVRQLYCSDPSFGKILGRLYGWNTLGAVAGALAGEVALFGWLGLRGAGFVAAGLNLLAAAVALGLARGRSAVPTPVEKPERVALSPRGRFLLLGSFLAGAILLALEVVWFRFLQLFVIGTTFSFAVMLATVLAGIGLGGIAASWWLRFQPTAHRFLVATALAGGSATLVVYIVFAPPETIVIGQASEAGIIVRLFVSLMFPASVLSGVLFTLFGEAAQRQIAQETRTAGLLTLANTLGAMSGALIGGFVLLPILGLERSFFLLGMAYGLVALCALEPRQWRAPAMFVNGVAVVVLLVLLVAFPFDSMREFLDRASAPYRQRYRSKTVALREGLTETIQYLQHDFEGRPLNHRLMTNGYSMSGTALDSKRYMKYFVYWPVTVHPDPEQALLIGYGAGSTAKALTETAGLEQIDVVDISRDILALSEVVYPDPQDDPLNDPRLQVHVEDGRYFLQTTTRRYDLITAEPPPPIVGGAVNLYSREYFELIRERLAEGGLTTYWLPVGQMSVSTSRSILAAFCEVFEDCSLWSGCQLDWVMIGSRDASGPISAERFGAQWSDPVAGREIRALGLEKPEQLGATFIADSLQVQEIIAGADPVTDDRPKRLSLRRAGPEDKRQYRQWADPSVTERRFRESSWIRARWPESLIDGTLSFFEFQRVANMQVFGDDPNALALIERMSARGLRTAPLWLMNHSIDQETIVAERVAEGAADGLWRYLGASALADRQYAQAAEYFARDTESFPRLTEPLRVLALCEAGQARLAREVARRFSAKHGRSLSYSCW
jgi:predicted membrane-bound spermidine synthase